MTRKHNLPNPVQYKGRKRKHNGNWYLSIPVTDTDDYTWYPLKPEDSVREILMDVVGEMVDVSDYRSEFELAYSPNVTIRRNCRHDGSVVMCEATYSVPEFLELRPDLRPSKTKHNSSSCSIV